MNPTPPSSNVSGQAWAGHRVLLLKLSSIVRHGGAEYTFRAFAILACCHPGKTQSCPAFSVAMSVRVATMRKARKGMWGANGDPDARGVDGEG